MPAPRFEIACTSEYWGGPRCGEPATEAVVKWDQDPAGGRDVYVVAPVCDKHGPRRVPLEVVDEAQEALAGRVWFVQPTAGLRRVK